MIDKAGAMPRLAYRGRYHAAHALTCRRKSCVKEKTYGPQSVLSWFHAVALCVLLFPWIIASLELQHLPSFVCSVTSCMLVHGDFVLVAFSLAMLRLVMGSRDVASTQGVLLSRHLPCSVYEDCTVRPYIVHKLYCVEDRTQPVASAVFSRTPLMMSVVQWASAFVAIALEIGRSCRHACFIYMLPVDIFLQGFSGLTGWLTSVRRVQISSILALVGSIPTMPDFLFFYFWSVALNAINAIGVNAIGANAIIAVVVVTYIKTSSVKTAWNCSKPVVLNVLVSMVLSQMSRGLQSNQLLWFVFEHLWIAVLGHLHLCNI